MKKLVLAALFTLPLSALAATPGPAPANSEHSERRAELQEHAGRRMRLMMVVGLAEALELNEGEALKLAEKVRSFGDRRRPLQQEMVSSMQLLRRAAQGESAALAQVDQAVRQVLDNREKLAALDKEMFQLLSRDLPPQKRAKLALFLARFQDEVRKMRGLGRGKIESRHGMKP